MPDSSRVLGLALRSLCCIFACGAAAQAQTTLTTTPNPSALGQTVTLNAALATGATGKVTFFDGTNILGISAVSSGQASITTRLLPSGSRTLRALYGGDISNIPSFSTPVVHTVIPVAANGFQLPAGYPTAAGPTAAAIGDFNRDGKVDLATANSAGSISILTGSGDGSFLPAVNYPLTRLPRAIATGDFDGNGITDLAAAGAGGINILLGNANGSFQAAMDAPTGGDPAGIVVSDFNSDGKADISIVTQTDSGVYVLTGKGDGGFASPVKYTLAATGLSIAAGDVNSDGKPDLLVSITSASLNQAGVLLGNGDGTFQAASYFAAGATPHSMTTADFNADGKLDIALVNNNSSISVLLGSGSGSFQVPLTFSVSSPTDLAVGDFNADGKPDLTWTNGSLNTASVAFGIGDGNFQAAASFPAGGNPAAILIGELNADGKPDLVVLNSGNGVNQAGILLGIASGLTVAITDASLPRGANGAFNLVVTNASQVNPTAGAVTLLVNVPGTLNRISISGTGWQCTNSTCSRNDSLNPGLSYPPVIVTVGVPVDAPAQVTLQANVTGGSSAPASTSLLVPIAPFAPALIAPANSATGVPRVPTLSWTTSAGATSFDLYIGTTSPPPFLTNTLNTSYSPGTLFPCVNYFWQVFGRSEGGIAGSDIWSFTSQPFVVLLPAGAIYPPAGGTGTITVNTAQTCPWTATVSNSPWLTITSGGTGASNGTIHYSVAASTSPERTGTITVAGQLFNIIQAAGCPVSFSPAAAVDSAAQALNVAVTSTGCPWPVTSNANWLVVTTASSMTGNGNVGIAVAANNTNAPRTGTVTIGVNTFTVTQRQTATVFADVKPADQFFDAINLMRTFSISTGCSATPLNYCPDDNVSRSQMAVFIVRAVTGGDNFTYTAAPYFTDVPANHGFFKWIQKMRDLGITTGCGTNTFCPNDSVTRGQMAVFIVRARYGSATVFDYPTAPSFTDVPSDHLFFSWIQKMKQAGITTGCNATEYCPDAAVSRAQMAVFVMRGAFNQLLPAATPFIVSATPATAAPGQTVNVSIIGMNTTFAAATLVSAGTGIAVTNVMVTSPTTLTADLVVAADAALGPRTIITKTGGEEATLPNGFRIQ